MIEELIFIPVNRSKLQKVIAQQLYSTNPSLYNSQRRVNSVMISDLLEAYSKLMVPNNIPHFLKLLK